jgi:hypothetical protein
MVRVKTKVFTLLWLVVFALGVRVLLYGWDIFLGSSSFTEANLQLEAVNLGWSVGAMGFTISTLGFTEIVRTWDSEETYELLRGIMGKLDNQTTKESPAIIKKDPADTISLHLLKESGGIRYMWDASIVFVFAVLAYIVIWAEYGLASALTVFLALAALTVALVFGAAVEARFYQLRQKLDGIEKKSDDLKESETPSV